MTTEDLASRLDHTLLRPEASRLDVERLCREAVRRSIFAVCVFPHYVGLARSRIGEARVRVATVNAFPFGCTFSGTKEDEMRRSAADGAAEIDTVINISELKSGHVGFVEDEMRRLQMLGRELDVTVKFIIESGYLNAGERARVVEAANRVGVDFLKTSTGYGAPGANPDVVRYLRERLRPDIRIKAAGGVRTRRQALDLIAAGADRLGSSASLSILEDDPS